MSNWITTEEQTQGPCPVFQKKWVCRELPVKAVLNITALGVYEAAINGKRVGDFILAPGWTSYQKRIQVQSYDVSDLIHIGENVIEVVVGEGWYASPIPGWMIPEKEQHQAQRQTALNARLLMEDSHGKRTPIRTDESWTYHESRIRFSEIYDGEDYDANFAASWEKNAVLFPDPEGKLIPQEGELIKEKEKIAAKSIFITPRGEKVVDFGQEITGYVEFSVNAEKGDQIHILHGEMLDKNGNFYNANYRTAKAEIHYTCCEGKQTWHPHLTFFGFRYLKLEQFPGNPKVSDFTAVCVYSDLRRTGWITSGNQKLNQLISNIFWGQKCNYLDIPTDCPQRDERLGWTGDSQVFVKAGSYNYDIEKFFRKWLHDLSEDQNADGSVGSVVPNVLPNDKPSAGWGDTAVISPWQIYQTYGDKRVLEDQFVSMKRWVDYITHATKHRGLWTGGTHFGDWLGLDAQAESYKGASREDFIASAFYAHAVELLVKAGKVLRNDMTSYEDLYQLILSEFRQAYSQCLTQTEYVISLEFHLTENPQKAADVLAQMIENDGCQLRTGFIGTPYLLHVLSDHGYTELAYTLLLREKYPSWLYSVGKGATTIWEHWDGVMENGDFWSTDMNSFNHYAYGSVIDWIYEKAAGIQHSEQDPGFQKAEIVPHPDPRLGFLNVRLKTRHGLICSSWKYLDREIRYEITCEMPAVISIDGKEYHVEPGIYTFWSQRG